MKKITLFFALAIAFSSCSNDDDKNTEQQFFNLKEGNTWVYKKYTINEQGEATATSEIDTVKIGGTKLTDGKTYYKLTHTSGIWGEEELVRIDESGHLVYFTGVVLHPGTDTAYKAIVPLREEPDYGTISYASQDVKDVIIEGKIYRVNTYAGYLTSNPDTNIPDGEGILEQYAKGTGFVVRYYRYLSSHKAGIEYRLISYELK